jgi:hypothetical protein
MADHSYPPGPWDFMRSDHGSTPSIPICFGAKSAFGDHWCNISVYWFIETFPWVLSASFYTHVGFGACLQGFDRLIRVRDVWSGDCEWVVVRVVPCCTKWEGILMAGTFASWEMNYLVVVDFGWLVWRNLKMGHDSLQAGIYTVTPWRWHVSIFTISIWMAIYNSHHNAYLISSVNILGICTDF